MHEKVAASVSSLLFKQPVRLRFACFLPNHDGNGWKWMAMAMVMNGDGWWWMVMDGDGDGMPPRSPRRSALMWLDLRLPFTEIVGSVLKAAQAQYWQHLTASDSHSMSSMWNSFSIPVIWALVVPPIQHIYTYIYISCIDIFQHISTCSCSIPVTKDRVKALLFGEGSRAITAASLRGLASCVFHKMWAPSHGRSLKGAYQWTKVDHIGLSSDQTIHAVLVHHFDMFWHILTSEESESQKLTSRWCVQHSWEHLTLVVRCAFPRLCVVHTPVRLLYSLLRKMDLSKSIEKEFSWYCPCGISRSSTFMCIDVFFFVWSWLELVSNTLEVSSLVSNIKNESPDCILSKKECALQDALLDIFGSTIPWSAGTVPSS